MSHFMEFVDLEYKPTHQFKNSTSSHEYDCIQLLLSANSDSDLKAKLKKQAYISLSNYLDMFKRAESLK